MVLFVAASSNAGCRLCTTGPFTCTYLVSVEHGIIWILDRTWCAGGLWTRAQLEVINGKGTKHLP